MNSSETRLKAAMLRVTEEEYEQINRKAAEAVQQEPNKQTEERCAQFLKWAEHRGDSLSEFKPTKEDAKLLARALAKKIADDDYLLHFGVGPNDIRERDYLSARYIRVMDTLPASDRQEIIEFLLAERLRAKKDADEAEKSMEEAEAEAAAYAEAEEQARMEDTCLLF